MPAKKANPYKERCRFLERLRNNFNVKNEDDIKKLSLTKFVDNTHCDMKELRMLIALQKALKENSFFAWLFGDGTVNEQ